MKPQPGESPAERPIRSEGFPEIQGTPLSIQPTQRSNVMQNIPPPLQEALQNNPEAQRRFHALPPSHQREYIRWLTEARKPETQARRAEKTVQMLLAR